MEVLPALGGAVAGFGAGSFAGAFQHLLYREREFRDGRATGQKARLIRLGLGLAAALVVALSFRPGHYSAGPALLTALFGFAFLVVASTDFERRRIPNRMTYPAVAIALAVCWAWPDRTVVDIAQGVAFAAAVGGVLFIVGVFMGGSAGGLGLGDVKLMLLMGAVLGLPLVMYGLFLGMIAGGIPAVVMMARGRRGSHFSYGPYLAAGAVVVMLFPGHFL